MDREKSFVPHPERYRVIDLGDLRRVAAPFRVGQEDFDTGTDICLNTLADTPDIYLDGNVYHASANLVPSPKPPYSGTRWQLQLNSDGTWSILNQGQEDQLLSGSGSSVGLGREPTSPEQMRFVTTRWLMYRDRTGFRLRPGTAGWLAVQDGKVVLSNPGDAPGRWLYWQITRAN
jgi:hypothetical protein